MKNFAPLFSLLFFVLSVQSADAHVGYVVGEENFKVRAGGDTAFLLSVFTNPVNIVLIVLTVIIVTVSYIFLSRNKLIIK